MNIFFISSPRGIPNYLNHYIAIIDTLKKLGHQNISGFPENIQNQAFFPNINSFYDPTVNNIKKSSICIFETTTPSIGVGHLLSLSLQMDKPIIALYLKNNLPTFLEKINNDRVQVLSYSLNNITNILKEAINYASNQQDSRFNMMLPSSMNNFLEEITKQEHTSKATYIRNLILNDKKQREVS